VFPNLRRTYEYEYFPLLKQLSFHFLTSFPFIEKKYFHGNMGTYKIGELPPHNALGFFYWRRRSVKITHRNKRELCELG
jgi:hypothetical protein